jgi:hypothetical protein
MSVYTRTFSDVWSESDAFESPDGNNDHALTVHLYLLCLRTQMTRTLSIMAEPSKGNCFLFPIPFGRLLSKAIRLYAHYMNTKENK